METPKGQNVVNSGGRSVVYELPLGESSATFNLQKAVCSHGFFMTAPNHWDPHSKTLRRPLRLLHSEDRNGVSSSASVTVQISQPPHSSHLLLRVFDTDSLSSAHQQSLMEQVRRMLRLSKEEEKSVREFQEIYGEAKESGFGRIFRSPTLFEDMVKCILVCNCQWSRTLSMARALCELQLELQPPMATEEDKCTSPTTMNTQFSPKTPAGKEASKRKIKSQEKSRKIAKRCAEFKSAMEADATLRVETDKACVEIREAIFLDFVDENPKLGDHSEIGNFPSPKEVANLDVNFLKKRCNLGYRANRILGLAQSVVEGTIQLGQLEQDSSLSNYINLNEQLGKINGFGPFTCANVLMCMGFYHVIPSDSETIRHLYQVHGKKSTIKSIQHDIEMIYTKYAPFQFLVYWSEIWSFYEERFGKMSELPNSDYKLITAANMRGKAGICSGGKIL